MIRSTLEFICHVGAAERRVVVCTIRRSIGVKGFGNCCCWWFESWHGKTRDGKQWKEELLVNTWGSCDSFFFCSSSGKTIQIGQNIVFTGKMSEGSKTNTNKSIQVCLGKNRSHFFFWVRAVVKNENGLSHKAWDCWAVNILWNIVKMFGKNSHTTSKMKMKTVNWMKMDDAWATWKQKVKEIAINEWKKEKRKRNSLRKRSWWSWDCLWQKSWD